jgi:hypothetical protein
MIIMSKAHHLCCDADHEIHDQPANRQAGIRVANITSNPNPPMVSVGPQISCAYSGRFRLACLPMRAKRPAMAARLFQFTRAIDMAASKFVVISSLAIVRTALTFGL